MRDASDSPYLDCPLGELAAAIAREAVERYPNLDDPVLTALGWETGQFMMGACSLLAAHLHESRGLPAVILEGHAPGQRWMMRHAAVFTCTVEEAHGHIRSNGGYGMPVLDAAGGGDVAGRMNLYREPGWEYRVILAEDPACTVHAYWQPNERRPSIDIEHTIADLPALAHALGVDFDLRATLARILAEPTSPGRRGADGVYASGLPEWVSVTMAGP